MTFPTDDIHLGPRSFGARKGHEGIIWHTTESSGPSRASAVATADWQKSNPGSYNFIIYDGGILLTVPYLEASGGVNPASAYWAPERLPWLKELHSPAAYADPNAYLMNVAFSGKMVDLKAGKYPANMIDTAARLIVWFERSGFGNDNSVHSAHSDWQSNRSDPGSGVITRILARYAELKAPAPTPTPIPTPEPDYQALFLEARDEIEALEAKVVSQTSQIAVLKTKLARAATAAQGAAQAVTATVEALR